MLDQALAVGLKVAVQAALALTLFAGKARHIVVVLFFQKIVGHIE